MNPGPMVRMLIAAAVALGFHAGAAAASHPWHDAIAEVRPVAGDPARLRVTMRVDGARFEAGVNEAAGRAVDLDETAVRSSDDRLVAGFVARGMVARLAPADGEGPGERLDFHWVGREFVGTDLYLYFEWLAPPVPARPAGAVGAAPSVAARAVEVRAGLLLEGNDDAITTVSVPGVAAVRFTASDRAWTPIGVSLSPRTPRPAPVVRLGDHGPAVVVVAGPDAADAGLLALVADLATDHRVTVIQWPGLDGDAGPPINGTRPGDGRWLDWARHTVRLRIDSERTAAGGLVLPVLAVGDGMRVVPERFPPLTPATRRLNVSAPSVAMAGPDGGTDDAPGPTSGAGDAEADRFIAAARDWYRADLVAAAKRGDAPPTNTAAADVAGRPPAVRAALSRLR